MLGLATFTFLAAMGAGGDASAGTAVLYRPEIELHRTMIAALEAEDRSIVPIEVGQPWLRAAPPKRVVALGPAATRDARDRWPKLPRAELLTWTTTEPRPALHVSAHPQAKCTAEQLRDAAGDGEWMVLATPEDVGAPSLALALDARLVIGDLAKLRAAIASTDRTKLWLRATPSLAHAGWAKHLGRLSTTPLWIGSDAAGLGRFGVSVPIKIDAHGLAKRTLAWLSKPPSKQPVEEDAPCRRPR